MHITDLEALFGTRAVTARLATDADPDSDVLVLGVDYAHLAIREGGYLHTSTETTPTTPTRIVIDADSFLFGEAQRANPPHPDSPEAQVGWALGITTDSKLIQIPATTAVTSGGSSTA